MRKRSQRVDPLRANALRVEKPRPTQTPQRDFQSRPSWYHRVLAFTFSGERDAKPWDFDEDLSELEEDKEQEGDDVEQRSEEQPSEGREREERGREDEDDEDEEKWDEDDEDQEKWDEDDEDQEKWDEDDEDDEKWDEDDDLDDYDEDDEDYESERSYDGSDADYYYELKEMREERKRFKLQEQREKEQQRDMEKSKEEEVRVAYKSLKTTRREGKATPVGSLVDQIFNLFCSDHVDHFYHDLYSTKRVDFYRHDNEVTPCLGSKPSTETAMLDGLVYLDGSTRFNFGPFHPPKRGSRKTVKLRSDHGTYELFFKFLGNGYLKLKVSRELVFMGRRGSPEIPSTAPEVFKFVGIWRDPKEEAERSRTRAEVPFFPEALFDTNYRF